jgi:hypothetical protein
MIMTIQLNLKNNSPVLMNLSEEEQFQQVCTLLEKNIIEALKLANSTLRSKKYFQDLLARGLEVADASEIEVWLKYLVPRLGMRYVINVLEGKLIEQPQQVNKAMYWLPKFLNRANDKEMNLFRDLENKIINLKVSHLTV